MSSRWRVCNCVELGCSTQFYEDVNREQKSGRVMSSRTYQTHLKQLDALHVGEGPKYLGSSHMEFQGVGLSKSF